MPLVPFSHATRMIGARSCAIRRGSREREDTRWSRIHTDLSRQFIPRYNRALSQCRLCFRVADRPLISIIDDDESVREALWGFVRSVGFAVSTFASAEELVNSDQLGNADCLILDVCMPGMSGIELQRQLVACHCAVPVIFITAHEDEGMRAQALRGGAEAVLTKPFSEEALLDAIHAALSPQ
jgi:CheY-like chemotaxis protein